VLIGLQPPIGVIEEEQLLQLRLGRRLHIPALRDRLGLAQELHHRHGRKRGSAPRRWHGAAPGLQGEERMAALEVECDRLVALGATRVRRYEPAPPMSAGFIVMTDPEGNEFCLG
jgi:hypothetical protein